MCPCPDALESAIATDDDGEGLVGLVGDLPLFTLTLTLMPWLLWWVSAMGDERVRRREGVAVAVEPDEEAEAG